jgi:hypothetical protein
VHRIREKLRAGFRCELARRQHPGPLGLDPAWEADVDLSGLFVLTRTGGMTSTPRAVTGSITFRGEDAAAVFFAAHEFDSSYVSAMADESVARDRYERDVASVRAR